MPGIALATCAGTCISRDQAPGRDRESQKANPFIPEAQDCSAPENSRHLLGSPKTLLASHQGDHPSLIAQHALLAMPHFTFSIPGAITPGPSLTGRAPLCRR